jgi:amidase
VSDDLTPDSSALAMAAAVARKDISARELMDLHLARIAERNPELNAIVSLDEERAREGAKAADEHLASGRSIGPLHGLPFAVKDTHATAGWRTTYGSPLYADHVPDHDDLIVERIRRAGVVLLGKTNVPEFAAGSHTFNTVFGTTRNPHDPSRSAGGSSGGAAAALAAGMVPLADGSDMGGSLRNPASFCGVVGLRPSLGRVPTWPTGNQWETTSVGGPMARTVDDVALLLSVIAGPDPRVPLALGDPGRTFAPPVIGDLSGLRVGFSPDLGGAIAVDHEVAAVTAEAAQRFARAGARVETTSPDLSLGDDTFRVLRAWNFQASYGALLAEHPDAFKQSLADNIRVGADLTGADVARAYAQRTVLIETMRGFFEQYDALVLPVSQVPPFPADQEFPTEINGVPMASYLDWMRSAYLITVTGCPAISVPAGTTPDGLPVGVQIVAPHGADRRLLEIASAFVAAGCALTPTGLVVPDERGLASAGRDSGVRHDTVGTRGRARGRRPPRSRPAGGRRRPGRASLWAPTAGRDQRDASERARGRR